MITAMESESMAGYTRYLKLDKLDDITVAKAKMIFSEYVSKGIVIQGTFSDDDWMLNNEKHHAGLHFKVDRIEYDNNSVSEWTGCTAASLNASRHIQSFSLALSNFPAFSAL